MKVMVVYGTRPEIIKLSATLAKLEKHFDTTTVFTTQNYDKNLSTVFFEDLELSPPNYVLKYERGTPMSELGSILVQIENLILSERPDCFFILGDTNSCLSAIVAKKLQIPVFHAEAGNRCFDQRVPEETNRKIVDHVSDINLTYSTIAREYLLREGLPADRIIKTGSPMFEVLHHYLPAINNSEILSKLNLEENKFFVVSAHREENINSEKNFKGLMDSLNGIAEKYGYPIIVSTHPRTKKMIETKQIKMRPEIQFLKPMGFNDYNALQMKSFAVFSDSGTISEESSTLNFPALNIREAHERPEAMEEASVMMVGLNPERIMQGLVQLQSQKRGAERNFRPVADYSMPNVSEKMVRIILSYTDYVKRTVWREF